MKGLARLGIAGLIDEATGYQEVRDKQALQAILDKYLRKELTAWAMLAQSVPVKETFGGKTVWEGIVHIFKIHGHPQTSQAYAWSSPIEGSDKRRFFVSRRLRRRWKR